MRSAALTLGDSDGRPPRLGARPDAAARVVAAWLARPGLAALLGRCGLRSLLALGPAQAAALDAALAAASHPLDAHALAAAPSARIAALSRALAETDLRLDAASGGAALVWDDLAPPFDPETAALVEAVAVTLLARAAQDRAVARAPAFLGGPADRFCLPSALWPDAAAALADGAPELQGLTGWLRRAFALRFAALGGVEGPGLRLSARVAVEPEGGAMRVEALLEGPLAEAAGLWADGRAAPLCAGPSGQARLCGIVWAACVSAAPGQIPACPPVDLAVAPSAGGQALLAARIESVGGGWRLSSAPAVGSFGPWSPRPDPRQPMTLDLRVPGAP
jgi:hypothetical protein